MHPATAYQIVGAISSFLSFSFLVYWLAESTGAAYESGLREQEDLRVGALPAAAAPLTLNGWAYILLPLIRRMAAGARLGLPAYLNVADQLLVKAGWRSGMAPEQFAALSLTWSLLAALAFLLLAVAGGSRAAGVLIAAAGATVGFLVPRIVLSAVAENRVALIEKRLPFAIEFIVLSMEANTTFESAVRIYCDRMPDDPLAEEFRAAVREIEFGSTVQDALTQIARRLDSDAVTAFVIAVTTGLQTGQSLKSVIETQADVTRQRRYQAAEHIAKTASTKAIFPLFLTAGAVIILLIGPIVIKASRDSLF